MSTQIPVDDFTRSDETPLGGNYTVVPTLATLNLASNQVVSSTPGSCAAYNNAVSLGNDQWAQVDVTTFDTGLDSAMHPGPMLRVDTSVRTHYIGQVGGTANNGSTLERRVGGVKTTVQQENSTVNAAPMTVYLEIIGQVYNLKINGVSTGISGTDAGGLATGARIGLFCYATSVSSAVAIDNFTGGDFVTEPALPMGAYQSVKRGSYF